MRMQVMQTFLFETGTRWASNAHQIFHQGWNTQARQVPQRQTSDGWIIVAAVFYKRVHGEQSEILRVPKRLLNKQKLILISNNINPP